MKSLDQILSQENKPALFIGNGINIHDGSSTSSWDQLLTKLSRKQGVDLSPQEREEMSNTEFFDILDLARPRTDLGSLQTEFCTLMKSWKPTQHHQRIVTWAHHHDRPIITVNFDENLSKANGFKFFRKSEGFTDYYPWSSYFSDKEIVNPSSSFAIWHAHGMMRYPRSIRLGLTDYMGSVQRARSWVYNRNDSLRVAMKKGRREWMGSDTWLDILFFSPIVILGFSFRKDENFLRWLFLERAKIQKMYPSKKSPTWFVEKKSDDSSHRKSFFKNLGIEFVTVDEYSDIYENTGWGRLA